MIRDYQEWKAIVVEHYGSLDAFEDATSVRNMRKLVKHDIDEIDGFFAAAEGNDEASIMLHESFDEERATLSRYLDELDAWFAIKGIKP